MKRRDDERAAKDAGGIGPYAGDLSKLVPLRELDGWTVRQGEPDIHGWEIRTVSGRQLGRVHELLVDPDAAEVVVLDVDFPGTNHRSYVPIRLVQIDRRARVVLMDSGDLHAADELELERRAAGEALERRRGDRRTVRYAGTETEVQMDRVDRGDRPGPDL